ncbi:sensor histidine kinase [Janibacter terrae]|uniref:sensor histidine kinase n=1 Tax=Janibacter terrae TaxID=103817 RepID=UPI003818946B
MQAWWGRQSLHRHLVLLTTAIALVVAVGLVVGVQVALAGAANDATRQVLHDRAQAVSSEVRASTSEPGLSVPSAALDPGVVVYDGAGSLVAGDVPASMAADFRHLSTSPQERHVDVADDTYAAHALPFTTPTGQRGVVVATEPFAPYERTERLAVVVSAIAGALLVLVGAAAAALVSRRALAPVEDMARTADDWSERDLGRRFDLGPPTNEIRALAVTLDGLLDKVASAIRAEQRLTAELAHELRTPLTTIHGAADLLAMRSDLDDEAREDLDLIRSATGTMSTTITLLLDVARRDHDGLGRERTPLDRLADELRALPLPEGRLDLDLPSTLRLDVPTALAVRALAPVLTNALRVSDRVRVSARLVGRTVELVVSDSGPGLPVGVADDIFEPGWSGEGGSGLGLSLARRVARSGGGDVTLADAGGDGRGASFVVALPGASKGMAQAPSGTGRP